MRYIACTCACSCSSSGLAGGCNDL
jgi:hypothetical protein